MVDGQPGMPEGLNHKLRRVRKARQDEKDVTPISPAKAADLRFLTRVHVWMERLLASQL
jgi:hypothetical protein